MGLKELKEAFSKGWRGIYDFVKKLFAKIDNLQDQVTKLETNNQRLETKNIELEEKLKKLISEKSKDSRNSSKPPSTDGLKKKTKSLRKKSDKSSGGQKGHSGATLEMVADPDYIQTIELFHCKCCGQRLIEKNKEFKSRQVIDIEEKRKVTEYRAERSICSNCGVESIADFPSFCTKQIQYGTNVKALAVYFNKYQLIPLRRVKEIFFDLHGIKISEGSIVNFNKQLFKELEGFENNCKEALLQSEKIHSDESGGRCEKKLHWFQVTSNEFLTLIAFHSKRGKEAMDDIGILPNFKGKVVHDFFRSYFQFDFQHVLCNAHLLRELIFEAEEQMQIWAKKMIELLLEIKATVDKEKEKGSSNSLSPYFLKKYETKFDEILKLGNKKNPRQSNNPHQRGRPKQSSARNLLDRLHEHKSSYLAFMYDFNIPFDNNLAERDIRMLKLYIKISGCFRTLSGALYFSRIRSYISTVRKNNLNTFEYIKYACIGQPFEVKIAE